MNDDSEKDDVFNKFKINISKFLIIIICPRSNIFVKNNSNVLFQEKYLDFYYGGGKSIVYFCEITLLFYTMSSSFK